MQRSKTLQCKIRSRLYIAPLLLTALSPAYGDETIAFTSIEVICLKENSDRYMAITLDPFPFVPRACPTIEFEKIDFSELMVSSDEPSNDELVYLLPVQELRCLMQSIISADDGTAVFNREALCSE